MSLLVHLTYLASIVAAIGILLGLPARRTAVIAALIALGSSLHHVIRTRMYVTDLSKWEQVAKAHGEVFSEIRPATTIVEIAKLIDGDAQIEIEADAVVP